jgi:putative FmdB family regulatory protein
VPTYVYRCQQCGTTLERRQSFQDPPLTECEVCSGELRRVLQPVQVIFKGPGFYSTDYRAKSSTDGEAKSTSTNGEDKGSSSDSKTPAPAKSEAASSTSTTTSTGEATKSD